MAGVLSGEGLMNQKKNALRLSSISDLLFDGMIFRFISKPDDLRRSAEDMNAFIDLAEDADLDEKIKKIDSADAIIRRINDGEGVINAFTNFLEGSPYGIILIDNYFNLIFSNKKSKSVLDELFDSEAPKRLKLKHLNSIEEIKGKTKDSKSKLIAINRAANDRNIYVFFNKHNSFYNDGFNVLLIPDTSEYDFELNDELVNQYNLTNKEQALLSNLIKGLSLKEISDKASVSLNTVRSHLKSIFRKTDTKSQTDLIRSFLNHEAQLIDSYVKLNTEREENLETNPADDLFIQLSTKNSLCYREYGPSDGRPLVIFHNTLGSRFHIPYDNKDILEKHNRRIIGLERPGYGRSDPIKGYISNWNEMFVEFVSILNLSEFDILGNVFACPLILQFVNSYSELINRAILTSPVLLNHPHQAPLLGEVAYALSRIINFSPKLASKVYYLWAKRMKFNTDRYIRNMTQQYSGSAEQKAIEEEQFIKRLTLNFIESSRNNCMAGIQDSIFALTPRKFELSEINVPFDIWMGDEDSCIPVESAKEIYQSLPNKTFHICKGHGEDVFYHRFEEIIQ